MKTLLDSLYIGMPVHYYSHGSKNGVYQPEARAAVITEIPEQLQGTYDLYPNSPDAPEVWVTVFNPKGVFHDQVAYSADKEPGHWGFVDFTVRGPIR